MDTTLARIAEEHNTSPQVVALSWALQNGALVLPRSSNLKRIQENLQGFLMPSDATDRLGGENELGAQGEQAGAEASCGNVLLGEGAEDARMAVFLTDEDLEAINALDGTLAR